MFIGIYTICNDTKKLYSSLSDISKQMMYDHSFEISSLFVRYQIDILLLPLYQSSKRLGYIWFYYISQKPYVLRHPKFFGFLVFRKHGLRA